MNEADKRVVLELKNITKSFGETEVLKGISLAIHEGEFVTLLGSSGCGKTTTLRIIAGLEYPDSGEVLLEGKAMGDTVPEKRNVNTVFQNYALFPHMNVYDNIAYGLKLRKLPKAQIKEQVKRMLSLVQLEGFEKRMPSEMSGGQRQRVAIARALVNNPRVLLLDEPLGALDLQLRRQMQIELKKLQKKLGITFIYITHDQEEAINMSDVIVVMKDGYFEQAGSPAEIYDHPKTSYVASFVGSANVLNGCVTEVVGCKEDAGNETFGRGGESVGSDRSASNDESVSDDELVNCNKAVSGIRSAGRDVSEKCDFVVIDTQYGTMCCKTEDYRVAAGQPVTIAVRSENISVWAQPKSEYYLTGVIAETSFVGGMLRIVVHLGEEGKGPEVVISRHGINFHYDIGEKVYLEWSPQQAVFVDMEA